MAIGILRPVGEMVPLIPGKAGTVGWPSEYCVTWFESGTAALAVAIRLAVRLKGAREPTVVAPAYTCPDVVSAVQWAGASTVIADTSMGSPWFSLSDVDSALSRSAVAVVAPHFLGMPQPLSDLRDVCRDRGVLLIEDSAQLSVRSPAFRPLSDLIVLSFGRGKPIPAQGGALMCHIRLESELRMELAGIDVVEKPSWQWLVAAGLQNAAMTRFGYRAARQIPGLAIGETRFRPLTQVRQVVGMWRRLSERTIWGWAADPTDEQLKLQEIVSGTRFVDVPTRLGWMPVAPLLRYPILASDAADRDRAVRLLLNRGIGATPLYASALRDVPGIPELGGFGDVPNARDFGARLLTLPAHTGLRIRDFSAIQEALDYAQSP